MNKIYYIAQKIHSGKSEDKKVSRPIIRISRISIILAIAINIITLAVVTGFQHKVKDKVIGFGSHATISQAGESSTFESSPVVFNDSLQKSIQSIPGVKNIQPFAYKPALLQSDPDTNFYTVNGIDTFQIQQEIHGAVMKGVGKKFDWSFFQSHLIEGKVPDVTQNKPKNEVILSAQIAQDLNLKVGEKVNIFFVKSVPVKLNYTVTGIFKTGLQEFDEQVIIGDIRKVQELNDWGITTAIRVADTVTHDGQFVITADTRGGNGNYRHDWGNGYERAYGFTFCGVKDTLIQLISSDYYNYIDGLGEPTAIPDTAYLSIQVEGNTTLPCFPEHLENGEFEREYLNESGSKFAVHLQGGKKVTFEYLDGKGSFHNYIGGYEVEVNDFKELSSIQQAITVELYTEQDDFTHYQVQTIMENQEEIFMWLDFLDLNVIIIVVLMLLIGTINMGSGLLVLIITKIQFIGLLKALGTQNWDIRKLFLYQAVFIIFRGIVIGNIIGIGICLLQQQFNIIPLNPEVYYLDAVPIEVNVLPILLLNIGTIVLCTAALVIPSYIITKISPVKALKFD